MFREVVGNLDLVSPMSQCNGGRKSLLFDHGLHPHFAYLCHLAVE